MALRAPRLSVRYTATTALRRNAATATWHLAEGFQVFSSDHDPHLKARRSEKAMKVRARRVAN